jgi:acyl carrier protein
LKGLIDLSVEEMLQLIEQVQNVEANALSEDTLLEDVPQWDSLSILNLQIELTALKPDVSFDALRECETVGMFAG